MENQMKRPVQISVIMPAFNEEEVIESHVNQVAEFLYRSLAPDQFFEIIVVNDGSTDSTGTVIDRLASERDYLIALHHARNMGRGRGLRTGFDRASGAYVFTLDADLSYSPEHILRMLPPLETGEADIVLASAYHPQGSVANVPYKRALVSRLGNKLFSISLGGQFKTLTCMVRGYRREVLKSLTLFSDGKDIHLEIVQKALILGFKIVEVPADLKWRPAKRTSASKGMSARAFRDMTYKHLFFNFLLRPSMLLWVPILFLILIMVTLGVMTVIGYVHVLGQQPSDLGLLKYFFALRTHMLAAKLTYMVIGLCLLLLFQFLTLLFVAKQNLHHYQELFSFLTHIDQRLRRHEEES
ncbi:MAG: glycosyltransferase family 2 protein [Pseudomonadota bacterium]